MYRIGLTLCLALLSTAAWASPASRSTAPTPSTAVPVQLADASRPAPFSDTAPAAITVGEKKICKLLPSSYSHRSDRVCLTKEQWKQVDDRMND